MAQKIISTDVLTHNMHRDSRDKVMFLRSQGIVPTLWLFGERGVSDTSFVRSLKRAGMMSGVEVSPLLDIHNCDLSLTSRNAIGIVIRPITEEETWAEKLNEQHEYNADYNADGMLAVVEAVHRVVEEHYDARGDALVIGRSENVGKPIADMLTDDGYTVTVAHRDTVGAMEADVVVNCTHTSKTVRSRWEPTHDALIVDLASDSDNGFNYGKEDYNYNVVKNVGQLTSAVVIKNAVEKMINILERGGELDSVFNV